MGEENDARTALRAARKRAGLTVSVLSYLSGVSTSTISTWEKYGVPPSANCRQRLANTLNAPVEELFPGCELSPGETDSIQKRRELLRRITGGEKSKP